MLWITHPNNSHHYSPLYYVSFPQSLLTGVRLRVKTQVSALIKQALLTQIWPQVTIFPWNIFPSSYGSGIIILLSWSAVCYFYTVEPSRSTVELNVLQQDECEEHVGLGSAISWRTEGTGGLESSKREQCLWRLERLLGTATGVNK